MWRTHSINYNAYVCTRPSHKQKSLAQEKALSSTGTRSHAISRPDHTSTLSHHICQSHTSCHTTYVTSHTVSNTSCRVQFVTSQTVLNTHLVTPDLSQVTHPVTPHLSALYPVTKPHLSHMHVRAHTHTPYCHSQTLSF